MEDYFVDKEWMLQGPSLMPDIVDTGYLCTNDNGETNCTRITEQMLNRSYLQDDTVYTQQVDNNYNLEPHKTVAIPKELTFTEDSLVSVIAYAVLFCVSGFSNLLVFITLFKNRHRKSRVNLFIMHLCIADMIVTFIMIPLEIGWHITVSWQAGDFGCRILMFCRAFGFYLSSFILITISLDRYFAITNPLSLNDAGKRAKIMLTLAWLFSAISSIPQSVIFHVEPHPAYPWFIQCVTFNFFPSWGHELAYNLFNISALYLAPLIVIIVCYTLILCEMTRKTKDSGLDDYKEKKRSTSSKQRKQNKLDVASKRDMRSTFRRSSVGLCRIERARIRTLKMTIVIVGIFITCWTPYFVISAWWWIDKVSAAKIDPKIQRALFLFAVSNSCVNPVIYGMFTHTFLREIKKMFICNIKFTKRKCSSVPFNVLNNTSSKGGTHKGLIGLLKSRDLNGSTRPTVVGSSRNNGGVDVGATGPVVRAYSMAPQGILRQKNIKVRNNEYQNDNKNRKFATTMFNNSKRVDKGKAGNSSGASADSGGSKSSKRRLSIAEQLTCTACAVALPETRDKVLCDIAAGIKRVDTPPHISVGKGTKDAFEKYLLI